jgi:hypothetical protein
MKNVDDNKRKIIMTDETKIFNGKTYKFLLNYDVKYEKHMIAVLSLSKMEDYIICDNAYDLLGKPLENNIKAIWVIAEDREKKELFLQTSLVLRERLRQKIVERGYDISGLELPDFYYGMDIHNLDQIK